VWSLLEGRCLRGAARAGALENGGEEKSMNKDPKKPKDPSASDREKELDEAIEESFPASDPPPSLPPSPAPGMIAPLSSGRPRMGAKKAGKSKLEVALVRMRFLAGSK